MKFVKLAILALSLPLVLALALWQSPVAQAANQSAPLDAPTHQAISTLDDVRKAVVRIETSGSFWYRSIGSPSRRGTGSGFIINDQGLAVTNNHVVAGATDLRIWVDGESSPRSATILGVAECSDLAIIDIEGEGFPYLDWYDAQIATQLTVHAAGFPYGTPNYTLSSGTISDTAAQGDSYWSSVGNVIEHSAPISPGDSGGPLVDGQGKVVAVNYLRSRRSGLSYAISQVEAAPIIEQLSRGQDVDSIGISGESVSLTDEAVAVWISAVTLNSPAGRLGLQPGDIIWNIDGSFLDPNSLMVDYCDTLKRIPAGQTAQIEIYRTTSAQFLSGQINGQALRVITAPTNQELTIPSSDALANSAADSSTPDSGTPDAGSTSPGSYSLTPPTAWSLVDQQSRTGQDGLEFEVELGSTGGSTLMVSGVGSEDVRFVRIDGVHQGVRENLVTQGAVASCPSVVDANLTYGAYEMLYSRWSGCTEGGEVYMMTAKSRTAPYHMVGLLGSFVDADNGYDILLRVLGNLRVENPRLAVPPASPAAPVQLGAAIVIVEALNVRSGPGTNNAVIGQVTTGDQLAVIGQTQGCGWLQVLTPAGVNGWVSGNTAYVRTNGCQ